MFHMNTMSRYLKCFHFSHLSKYLSLPKQMPNKIEYFLMIQCHTKQLLFSNDEILGGNLD